MEWMHKKLCTQDVRLVNVRAYAHTRIVCVVGVVGAISSKSLSCVGLHEAGASRENECLKLFRKQLAL